MSRPSRRHFIQAAGAIASAPAAAHSESAFAPGGALRKLSENLYLFEDTCNVYVIRDGSSCVLIDFGSGAVIQQLAQAGISKVEWILHTHHHRDQCQGDQKAMAKGIPIAVPAHEKHLFADAENFWRNRRVFHLYYVRNDFNTITRNIAVEKALTDYSTFRWHNFDFFVLPTPGHTLGSITLVTTVDGRKVAFSGDLMHSPGKILNLHDTQVNYGGSEGIDLGIYSLARLREQKPALMAPSHGEPLDDPETAIRETMRRLSDYYRFQTGQDPSDMGLPFMRF
jgi:glyoxylase-like metal-dependent hydrolase (beta-lactamase superfamily II)